MVRTQIDRAWKHWRLRSVSATAPMKSVATSCASDRSQLDQAQQAEYHQAHPIPQCEYDRNRIVMHLAARRPQPHPTDPIQLQGTDQPKRVVVPVHALPARRTSLSSSYLLTKARLRNMNTENASSQNDNGTLVAADPAMMRIVYKAANVTTNNPKPYALRRPRHDADCERKRQRHGCMTRQRRFPDKGTYERIFRTEMRCGVRRGQIGSRSRVPFRFAPGTPAGSRICAIAEC